ncbi:MAG: hypothetical protein ABSB74_06585 [Tepidisphaeraceae bacterium]
MLAGKINGSKRRPWDEHDRQRLRQQCLDRKPWLRSTGPRSDEGKYRFKANGFCHRPDPDSPRQIRASLGDVNEMIAQMGALRREIFGS